MSANRIPLDELLARQVDVQWFEGVAVVQAICRQLLAKRASSEEFPGAAQIGIGADGAVWISGTTATPALPAAAHLLAGLLSDDVPVRLRLAVSQATGQSSSIESLREFSETLGYFERPAPQEIVRNLFERAMLAGFRKQDDAPGLADPGPEKKRQAAVKPSPNTKAMLRRAAIAAAAVIMIAAASWAVLIAARSGPVNAAFSGLKEAVAGAPEASVDQPSASPEGVATKGTTPAPPRATHGSTAPSSRGQSGETRKERGDSLALRLPSLVPDLTSVMSPAPSPDASNATEPQQADVIVASERDQRPLDPIYSRSDSDVTPPRQIYPALPAEPLAASMKRGLTVVDLVIAPDGLVERVHLRTPPRNVLEFMFLSAAKAWRFEPALLDGRPVRFRYSVALTSFQ
jgi:hypothetical protein